MIGWLEGQAQLFDDALLVINNGVGYVVQAHQKTIQQAVTKETTQLYIHTIVREDRFDLYGFTTMEERTLFGLVLGVSGVGPSIAINIVGAGVDSLVEAVQQADTSFFSSVPRVGKKLAQKCIIELGSKLGQIKQLSLGESGEKYQEIVDSLVGLGMTESDVRNQIDNLSLDIESTTPEAIIKAVLSNRSNK